MGRNSKIAVLIAIRGREVHFLCNSRSLECDFYIEKTALRQEDDSEFEICIDAVGFERPDEDGQYFQHCHCEEAKKIAIARAIKILKNELDSRMHEEAP